jgi:integrase
LSNLKLTNRGGIWYATGTIAGQRIRKSLGTSDRQTAAEIAAQFEAGLWKRYVYGDAAVRTFEEAALSYMNQGGEPRFLAPLLIRFKGRAIGSIKPGELREAALALYPQAAPATRNRQAIVPARAVINHAASLGWCQTITARLFPSGRSQKHQPVDRDWIDAFMTQADADGLPHLSGIVLFMHQTAARRSEAVRLMGDHIDLDQRVAVLERTKTSQHSVRHLTAELVLRIAALDPRAGQPVFRYTEPSAVNRRMS